MTTTRAIRDRAAELIEGGVVEFFVSAMDRAVDELGGETPALQATFDELRFELGVDWLAAWAEGRSQDELLAALHGRAESQ